MFTLQQLAETTDDPREALLLFIASRSPEPVTPEEALACYNGEFKRMKKYLADLLYEGSIGYNQSRALVFLGWHRLQRRRFATPFSRQLPIAFPDDLMTARALAPDSGTSAQMAKSCAQILDTNGKSCAQILDTNAKHSQFESRALVPGSGTSAQTADLCAQNLDTSARQSGSGALWEQVEAQIARELTEKSGTSARTADLCAQNLDTTRALVPESGTSAQAVHNANFSQKATEGPSNKDESRQAEIEKISRPGGPTEGSSELIADPACTLKALSSLSCTEGTGEHCTAKAARAAQLLNDAKFSDKLRSSDEDFSEAVFQQLRAIDNCGALTPGRIREWSKIIERSPDKVAAEIRMLKRTGWVDKAGEKITNNVAYLAAVGRKENW